MLQHPSVNRAWYILIAHYYAPEVAFPNFGSVQNIAGYPDGIVGCMCSIA